MFFFDHRPVQIILLLSAIFAAAIWLWRKVVARRKLVRLPLRLAAFVLAFASSVLLVVDGCVELTTVKAASLPLYSPDGRHAVVVRDWDAGALAGGSNVDLYSYGGVLEENILGGEFKVVEVQNIQWTSNDALLVRYWSGYPGYPDALVCVSPKYIKVTCVPCKLTPDVGC